MRDLAKHILDEVRANYVTYESPDGEGNGPVDFRINKDLSYKDVQVLEFYLPFCEC